MLTGLDRLVGEGFARLRGRRVGVVCNQASITRDCKHILTAMRRDEVQPLAVFGPQHGLYGHTQDNMIEWEPDSSSRPYRLHSLYGAHREPTEEMLQDLDILLIDLQDVGARYYTFIWTMSLCLRACERAGIPVLVLDRPNPIGGLQIEGEPQEPGFNSFVGLHPIPIRHACTIGELASKFRALYYPAVELEVVDIEGWSRDMYWLDTGLPWGMTSPNMPTADTAIVYPGGCLLEATNISEGRGTTRPFEIVGAPWLDADHLVNALNQRSLPGVIFRELEFQPTFNKHAGEICGGCFVHVVDKYRFEPVRTYMEIIETAKQLGKGQFAWKEPPYEYEFQKMPIDILTGSSAFRCKIDKVKSL